MPSPLQLLIGTNSLRNRIKRQSALLPADIERVKAQTRTLQQSAVRTAISPLGLAATAAVGFATGRALQQPHRKHEPKDAAAVAQRTLWWELLLPLGFAWIRNVVVAQMQRNSEKKSP